MMSLHIGARPGDIADSVLITGDPLRARHIAESMLTEILCYNEIRGMLGYTGYYQGKRVSVQGTGIGIPSTAIYLHELIHDYGVRQIIRLGTCGAIHPSLSVGDLVLAEVAYTDSSTHLFYHTNLQTPSYPDRELFQLALETSSRLGIAIQPAKIFSTDLFYKNEKDRWNTWAERSVKAIEMESSILFDMGQAAGIRTLTLLSVSDSVVTQEGQTARQREEANPAMTRLALEVITARS